MEEKITSQEIDALIGLLHRSEGVWKDQTLLNLVQGARTNGVVSANKAFKRVKAAYDGSDRAKVRKARQARFLAQAYRDYDKHLVSACVNWLQFTPQKWHTEDQLRTFLNNALVWDEEK